MIMSKFRAHIQSEFLFTRVCVSVQLSLTVLGNEMSPLCTKKGNRDSWLELQTLALP